MAHEITSTDSIFVTRHAAWHGLGTVLPESPTSSDALKHAGLTWKVAQSPCSYFVGETLTTDDSAIVNYRDDNGQLLGVVGKGYKIVQNEDAFAFADYLVGEGITYETAGSIKGGKNVWLLAKMPEQKILGDDYKPYMLLVNGHDGRTSVNVCMTPVRVVCSNTINLALRGATRRWIFSHTSNVMSRISDAQQTLRLAGNYMQEFAQQAELLASKRLHDSELQAYIARLFPAKEGKTANKNNEERIERFKACYEAFDIDNVRGTAYGFLLAVSDYTSHVNNLNEKQREQHFVHTVMQPATMLSITAEMLAS